MGKKSIQLRVLNDQDVVCIIILILVQLIPIPGQTNCSDDDHLACEPFFFSFCVQLEMPLHYQKKAIL